VKFSDELSGTLLRERDRPDDCCPVRNFDYVVQTKSIGLAYATHFTSSLREIDQIQACADACSGRAACLTMMIDHEWETDRHLSLRAIRTVEPTTQDIKDCRSRADAQIGVVRQRSRWSSVFVCEIES
jgi:hypothetical protein